GPKAPFSMCSSWTFGPAQTPRLPTRVNPAKPIGGIVVDRMSALDASFWDLESKVASLNIGCAAVFEGPVPGEDEIYGRYSSAIARVRRYRQRMQRVPFGLARP